jgi:hypothetical protein
MVTLIMELEKLGFHLTEDGSYISKTRKTDEMVLIQFVNHYLECYVDAKLIFSLLYAELKTETFLMLLAEYGIIQKTIKR